MENEDIIELANKYAKEMISSILSLVLDNRSNRIDELKAVYKSTAESFLHFLLKDFYIVEKSKVLDRYDYIKTRLSEIKNLGSSISDRDYNEGSFEGQQDLLESLFSEILKNK